MAVSPDPTAAMLHGDVVDVVNMGAEFHYIVESVEGRIMVVEPNRVGPRVQKGERVTLHFRAEDCVVLARDGD
jgi:ABC-type Fe3+/spermidine/putrescine transport system ATPase subunit